MPGARDEEKERGVQKNECFNVKRDQELEGGL